ncbi:hypothetical protein PUN28_012766 [Cardiocondyla obscurior]|uniref:Secreted protein n=1 Tax=Cardiocondyla obscurior TaxID=286306 RepID=A0AAW2F6Q4_9HYME
MYLISFFPVLSLRSGACVRAGFLAALEKNARNIFHDHVSVSRICTLFFQFLGRKSTRDRSARCLIIRLHVLRSRGLSVTRRADRLAGAYLIYCCAIRENANRNSVPLVQSIMRLK